MKLLAAIVCVALTPASHATDRYYLDSYATSPNGRFRIDAKSPDNAGPNPRPFAANFTYSLTGLAPSAPCPECGAPRPPIPPAGADRP